MSLVAAADLAIASDDAYFTLAYCHIGLSADGGASYFLPRIVGERRALEAVLLGERITAQKALDWGLLTGSSRRRNWMTKPIKSRDVLLRGLRGRLGRPRHCSETRSIGLGMSSRPRKPKA